MANRLGIGRTLHRLLPSALQVVHRPGGVTATTIVISQRIVVLWQALGKKLLDGLRSAPMQPTPSFLQQTPVGHLVGEGVFKSIYGGWEPPRLIEELGGLEVAEMCVELCGSEVGHGLEERHGDLHPDDGSGLQQALLFRWQAIDACRQHRLDRLRHRQRCGLPLVFDDVPG